MSNKSDPWVLGISASHNGAACLLKGKQVVVAIQEERLLGWKRARLFLVRPSLAVNYCLEYAGLKPSEIDLLVVSSSWPVTDPSNNIATNHFYQNIKDSGIPVHYVPHHAAHVISAFATSGFRDAAGLVIDGLGSPPMDMPLDEQRVIIEMLPDSRETISLYFLDETVINPLEKQLVERSLSVGDPPPGASMKSFGSLGGMFEAISAQIFGDQMEAGKVMGLAPYGKPTIGVEEFFAIHNDRFLFPNQVCKRFTDDLRWPHHKQEYQDLACSVQVALETALEYLTGRLQQLCPSKNLVYAEGA
ncbi:MAG: carbamoyltransferase N-terminal domain-containing protein [Gammaproteobacteria bacterium]